MPEPALGEAPAEALARLRAAFASGLTRPLTWRLAQLAGLRQMLHTHEGELAQALFEDLGKPPTETFVTEIASVARAIRELERRLPGFARVRRVRVPLAQHPGRARVAREPRGVCAVVAPWNYPVQLLVVPMASALGAGNCVVAKPSELAPATSGLLTELIGRYLDGRAVAVLEGDAATTQAIIAAAPDHLFFTGSGATGRAVLAAAVEHLTPVTLELGGKCPAIVDDDADLTVAARRIVLGKFINAGQSCVAPDYVLVSRAVAQAFSARLVETIAQFFGEDPGSSPDYGRIVNAGHFARLVSLAAGHGGRVLLEGRRDATARLFAPTVIADPDPEAPVMREEIFGPVLPVVTVENLEEATRFVAARPSPLAIYVFARHERSAQQVREATRSGSVCLNTAAEQFVIPALPFGGIGASGVGSYHGVAGLETFSYPRAQFSRPARPDLKVAYPPITPAKRRVLRRALRD